MAHRIAVLFALIALAGCGQKPSPSPVPTPPQAAADAPAKVVEAAAVAPVPMMAPVPAFVPAASPVAADPATPKPLLTFGDPRSGQLPAPKVTQPAPHTPYQLIFRPSADGKRLVTSQRNGDGRAVRVWDAATGKLIDHLTKDDGWYEDWWSNGISTISPTARWLACGEGPTHDLTVWDVGAGKVALRVPHPNPPGSKQPGIIRMAFEPVGFPTENELWVLDRPAAEFRLLELPSGKILRTLAGFKDVWHVCLSPDGKRLAASGWEGVAVRSLAADGKWEVVDRFTADDRFRAEGPHCGLEILPRPPVVGFTTTNELRRGWDGRFVRPLDELTVDQAWPSRQDVRATDPGVYYRGPRSPDGRKIYTTPEQHVDKTPAVVVVELCTGRVVGRLPVPCTGGVAVSPDGTRLYTSNADGTIGVWDLPALEAKHLPNAGVKDHWDALASPDPKVGYAAVRQLAADRKAVGWLKECFARPRETPLAKLIADLGHADYPTREAATKKLDELGSPARSELERVVEQRPSEEAAERAERLLTAGQRKGHQEWAGLSLEQVREVRAVEVLERVGNPAAVEVLTEWVKGESPVRKAEATAALARRK